MKNELVLENYGVQELQAVEKIDVDGGNFNWDMVLMAIDALLTSASSCNVTYTNSSGSEYGWVGSGYVNFE